MTKLINSISIFYILIFLYLMSVIALFNINNMINKALLQ